MNEGNISYTTKVYTSSIFQLKVRFNYGKNEYMPNEILTNSFNYLMRSIRSTKHTEQHIWNTDRNRAYITQVVKGATLLYFSSAYTI